ncbi:pecanex-like protein 3, partial [Limulus polyphemus]|uniref:Pecanex-like protein n=1 Tax=Limulus polyphemus TaxID=6850 RepID=A0ABM1TMU0_LIMPO
MIFATDILLFFKMGSQTLEILRQGIWASFTGGWFYDPRQDHFCNTFHLYLWMLLLCLPFVVYMFFPSSVFVWSLYCGVVGVVVTMVKVINIRLHCMFDNGECVEDASEGSVKSDEEEALQSNSQHPQCDSEHIEMAVLKPRRGGDTPPVQCSSRNSFPDSPVKHSVSHVGSMDIINKLIGSESEVKPCSSTIDLEVDVHHRNSSGSSEEESLTCSSQNQRHSIVLEVGDPASSLVAEILQEVEGSQLSRNKESYLLESMRKKEETERTPHDTMVRRSDYPSYRRKVPESACSQASEVSTESTPSKEISVSKKSKLLTRRKHTAEGTPETCSLLPERETSDRVSRHSSKKESDLGPPTYILASILSKAGTHLASSHGDTSPGAVHCFQDEYGNWFTYTFDEHSCGLARGLEGTFDPKTLEAAINSKWNGTSQTSSSSGSTVILDSPAAVLHALKLPTSLKSGLDLPTASAASLLPAPRAEQEVGGGDAPSSSLSQSHAYNISRTPLQIFAESLLSRATQGMTAGALGVAAASNVSQAAISQAGTDTDLASSCRIRFTDSCGYPQKPRQFYKFWIVPCKYLRVRFDRLTLLALLDRNITITENVVSVMLVVLVAILGALCLANNFFHDIWTFVFCFVIASCQYTLLK